MARMKVVGWVAAASIASAIVASAASGRPVEVWLGMIAPLVVACGSWIWAASTYERQPDRLTAVMMTAFAAKLVIFGAYFALALGVLHVRPMAFAISFAGYFIALHMTEALGLQRMFAERMRAA